MKNKTFIVSAAAFAVMGLLSGCSLLSPDVKKVNYYDLSFSGKEKFKVNCRFETRNFHNISPARLNLLFTSNNSVIELDQYNYWVQSPEVMLRRFFLNAIETTDTPASRVLDASLTIFEFKFDLIRKEAVLGINLVLRDKERNIKKEKNYIIKNAVAKSERPDFVNAMNKCTEQFINQAVNDIKKI